MDAAQVLLMHWELRLDAKDYELRENLTKNANPISRPLRTWKKSATILARTSRMAERNAERA